MASYAPTPSTSSTDVFPTVDQFADALSTEPHWYNLGIILQLPTHEMDRIELAYSSMGPFRCLIEVYKSLASLDKVPSWEYLSQALRRINNIALANEICTNYVTVLKPSSSLSSERMSVSDKEDSIDVPSVNVSKPITQELERPSSLSSERSSRNMSVNNKEDSIDVPSVNVPKPITREFQRLSQQFSVLATDIIDAIKRSYVDVSYLQHLLYHEYNITPLPPADATIDNIFLQLRPHYCHLNYSALTFITKTFLKEHRSLKRRFSEYKSRVTAFKNSTKMGKLKQIVKKTQSTLPSGCKEIKLKVRENWSDVTLERFEAVIKKIMPNVYRYGTQIIVNEGCIAISWIVSNMLVRKANMLIEDVVFQIIGILSVHIDDEVIYDYQGEGCETIEAAMLQAIELKNTRAIQLLLTMDPEVATYTDDNAVTTIVNIRENPGVATRYTGDNAVTTIVNTRERRLHEQEQTTLHQERTTLYSQTDELQLNVKTKDAENTLLQKDVELLIKEKQTDKITIEDESKRLMNDVIKPIEPSTSTAVLPRQQLGIGAEMRVKIITNDNNGKELDNGGSTVRAVLSCNKEECPVTKNNDGTYYVTVIPEQLGQHQLSITIDNQHIQNSPFSLTIVPQRDYSKLIQPVQTTRNINGPRYIAFSDNGDMFVTSDDHCIYVYGKSGNKKTTIGSKGRGELQFDWPRGIDINGDIVYVAEQNGHRIHMLTTGGKFISTFGEKGSDVNQFDNPYDVKISPDNKVYVADSNNNRIQVFHSDWTISHVINGRVSGDGRFSGPEGIAFDLSGNVHVTGFVSNSVTVFTPSGQFIRQYDTTHSRGSRGIAIDPSGYSLVANWGSTTLSVFDPNGVFIHYVRGLNRPTGISVANGGVWVADNRNSRLVKY